MNVYYDAKTLSALPIEQRLKCLHEQRKLLGQLKQRADCTLIKWSPDDWKTVWQWLSNPSTKKILRQKLGDAFANSYHQFLTGYFVAAPAKLNVLLSSSSEGSLCCGHSNTSTDAVLQDCGVQPGGEAVRVTSEAHLSDDAVCRVLYCNNPNIPENATTMGYVIADYKRHSKVTQRDVDANDDWISKTTTPPAQLLPKYHYNAPAYAELIRIILKKAMTEGCYSENALDGARYEHCEVVGASSGKKTSGVYLDFHGGAVHLYPKDIKEA